MNENKFNRADVVSVASLALALAAILATALVGYFNCQATNEASDRAVENADRIGNNTEQIAAATDSIAATSGRTEEHTQRIDTNTAGIHSNTTDISVSSRQTAENTSRIADRLDADSSAPENLGECQAGLEVRANQYCSWMNSVRRFIVYEDGAYSPLDTTAEGELNRATIKVDFGPPRDGTTFQARSSAPGVWEVLVAGAWQNVGQCSTGMIIAPGQLCVERQSQQPFLVYATDELIEGDDRPLYPDGYAVLFWWKDGEVPHPDNGRLHDQQVASGDHFEAARRSGASWEIVKAD